MYLYIYIYIYIYDHMTLKDSGHWVSNFWDSSVPTSQSPGRKPEAVARTSRSSLLVACTKRRGAFKGQGKLL